MVDVASGTAVDGPSPRGAGPGAAGRVARRRLRPVARLATVVGALGIAGAALIHLHLWTAGYRHIPTIGPMFLAQSVTGLVLAVVVALWHRWYVAGAGALFLLATAGGLVVSVERGLFGFKDSFSAPFAHLALLVEVAGVLVLIAAGVLDLRLRREVWAAPSSAVP